MTAFICCSGKRPHSSPLFLQFMTFSIVLLAVLQKEYRPVVTVVFVSLCVLFLLSTPLHAEVKMLGRRVGRVGGPSHVDSSGVPYTTFNLAHLPTAASFTTPICIHIAH